MPALWRGLVDGRLSKESFKTWSRAYRKPCHNQITRANREKNGGARNYHLRRRYGITADHFDEMFAEQGGLCAICREAAAAHEGMGVTLSLVPPDHADRAPG